MGKRKQFASVLGELKHSLEYMAALGCRGFECSENNLKILSEWGKTVKSFAPQKAAFGSHKFSSETLEALRNEIGDCKRCKLYKERKHIVFGEGNPNARLVFVGEGPGYEEDQSGRPFVGEAGQLLTRIIQAMKLRREEVYICNVVKCRPPGNRIPQSDEIRACLPFLKHQLSLIAPEFICTLGAVASQTLLKTEISISKLRGKFHTYKNIRTMPTFHPAYLLRSPDKKREVWEDVQKIMKEMEKAG